MCGILGLISTESFKDTVLFSHALNLMEHRGPDGSGTWDRKTSDPPFVRFGHRRLAIIDLSEKASQPMLSVQGTACLVYNGEIYNYKELMHELSQRGYEFASQSDTEVLINAYLEWGEECLSRLNGMFAFAIWDERKKRLFAARDRFGEKPFHYYWDPKSNRFAFASEIKPLLMLPFVEPSLNERALYRFVAFQELAGSEETLWCGIRRLRNSHSLMVEWDEDCLHLSIRKYWDIDLQRQEKISLEEAARKFRELFEDSVRLRLRSDVPVGTSLSGGLDSSAVVCQIHAMGAAAGQKTFSARMEDPALDEGKYIREVLNQTGVEGHEVWPSATELERIFPRLCYYQEEPFLSTSQFAQHLVMRLAKENGVTVLLDGQGADELLAGYKPYFLARYGDLAQNRQMVGLWREWHGFRAKHDRAFPLSTRAVFARILPGAYQLLKRGSKKELPSYTTWAEMSGWWNLDWLSEFADQRPTELSQSKRDGLTRRLYQDTMCGELQELLRYGDRNSMAFSRELRQPFLDHRIAELVFALSPEQKLFKGETKVVMREAIKGLVPESIAKRQDKLGYQAPLASWVKGELEEWTCQSLEQIASEFTGAIISRPLDRFKKLPRPLSKLDSWAVFSLLTISETCRQMRGVALA